MLKFYDSENKELSGIDFARVRLGETAQKSILVKNEGKFLLIDLNFSVNNPEVLILNYPRNLQPGSVGRLELKWEPKVNSEFGLKCNLDWSGDELRGAE